MRGPKTYKLDHDYGALYGKSDFSGELVLDVGADQGSTARFFLNHGARAVVCSEPSVSIYFRRLEAWAALDARVAVTDAVLSQDGARTLLDAWRPDTLKVDCEGCERHFLRPIVESPPPCLLVEVHGDGVWHEWRDELSSIYALSHVTVNEGPTGGALFRADQGAP